MRILGSPRLGTFAKEVPPRQSGGVGGAGRQRRDSHGRRTQGEASAAVDRNNTCRFDSLKAAYARRRHGSVEARRENITSPPAICPCAPPFRASIWLRKSRACCPFANSGNALSSWDSGTRHSLPAHSLRAPATISGRLNIPVLPVRTSAAGSCLGCVTSENSLPPQPASRSAWGIGVDRGRTGDSTIGRLALVAPATAGSIVTSQRAPAFCQRGTAEVKPIMPSITIDAPAEKVWKTITVRH